MKDPKEFKKEKLHSEWFKHLPTSEAEEFKDYVRNSTSIRERLTDILNKKLPETKEVDYDCPSWSHKQADANGYERALRELLKIITIRDQGE